jgi:UDP-3-O-[3-hydroxymyristoyl] glucosamine N-acyltransferase
MVSNTQKEFNLNSLSRFFDFKMEGDNKIIHSLGFTTSSDKDVLTFAENHQYLKEALENKKVKAIITLPSLSKTSTEKTLLLTTNPKHLFYQIHTHLLKKTNFYHTKQKSKISKSALIHKTASISKNNVIIGENVNIGPNVFISENTVIGNDVVIHANSSIGQDGFQCYIHDNQVVAVPHAGGVHIERNVRIGANSCVDKGLFKGQYTTIGKHTKIDNLVHVAHNVRIGQNCIIVAQTFLGGSCVLEDMAHVAMSASIRDGIKIGRKSLIGMGSVVTKDVPRNTIVTGVPARPFERNRKKSSFSTR